MDASFGTFFLALSLVFSCYAFVNSFVGVKNGINFLKKTSLASFHLGTVSILISSLVLVALFLGDHFEVSYVWAYSSIHQSTLYKLTGFFAGKEGSLLMWALVLGITSSIYLLIISRKKDEKNLYHIVFVLSMIQLFFTGLIYFKSSPFDVINFIPKEGKGLNPLLENFYMIVHPPALYLGFVIFTVPFAQALVSLYKKDFDGAWVAKTRRWILVSWFFLGVGNLLGSYWAYIELGWGGYWAWDPVENSSLIPWLISTGLVHSMIVQKKVKMFRIWNYAFIFATFISTIVATFLTRSGIVQSVHAFAGSEVANYFLGFIILLTIISFGLLIYRVGQAKKEKSIDSFVSKEAAFGLFNIIFLASGIAVLLGTLMPAISEWLINKKITLEAGYYNQVFSYIGLVLLFGLGVCPLLAWRSSKFDFANIKTAIYLGAVVLVGAFAAILGERNPLSILAYALSAGAISMALVKISDEFKRKRLADLGGMIAHIGIVLMIVGMTGTASKVEVEKNMTKGQEVTFEGYRLVSKGFRLDKDLRKEMIFAVFDLYKGEKLLSEVETAKFYYMPTVEGQEMQSTTEMKVYSTPAEDLLLILLAFDVDKEILTLKLIKNPLIIWLWIGGAILFLGTVLAVFKSKGAAKNE
jgi:cytochrome c-type biogenesis protein CcmF